MKKVVFLSLVVVLLVTLIAAIPALAGSPLHSVHVGGPDVCEGLGLEPGCDANFSLSAIEWPDSSVTGQWTDQFGHGNGGFHAAIDCLSINGNEAWVGGAISNGPFVGTRVAVRVADNGTSANDTADQISFTDLDPDNLACTEQPTGGFYELVDMPQGQVRIK